jgi:hypothetical protein
MLDAVLGYIEAHPEQHNQSLYGIQNECGTTACVAGHAVLMAGDEVEWYNHEDKNQRIMMSVKHDGQWMPVFEAARSVLDLSSQQAIELFYCWDNDIDVLKGIVKRWANEQ